MFITVSQLKTMVAIAKPESTKTEHERLFCAVNITKHDNQYWFESTNGAVATRFIVTDGINGFPETGTAYIPRYVIDNLFKILPKAKKHNNADITLTFKGNVVEISVPTANISHLGEFSANTKYPSFNRLLEVTETETNNTNGFGLFSSDNTKLFEQFLECNGNGVFGAYGVFPYKKQGGLIAFVGENALKADINHYRAVFIMLPYQYHVMFGYTKSTKAYL